MQSTPTPARPTRRAMIALTAGSIAAAAAQRTSAQTLTTVRLVGGPIEPTAGAYWAYEQGFFKQAGLNVEVQQARSGNVEAAAVAAGRADIGDSNVVSFAQAIARGVPFVAIAPGENYDTRDPMTVLAEAPNAPQRTAKDIDGMNVAVISLGSIAHLGVAAWLDKNGGNLASIKLVELTSAAVIPALETGRIVAGVVSEPQLSSESGQMRVLAKLFDAVAPRFMISVWFTTKEWATQNPDACRRFAQAILAADEWYDHNREQAQVVLEKWLHTKITKMHYTYSRTLDPALIQPVLDASARYKIIPRPMTASELIWAGK